MVLETKHFLRKATQDDIPMLVCHHRRMFEEISASQGLSSHTIDSEKLDREYARKLDQELGQACTAWVIVSARRIISSGALTIISMVPVPNDYSYRAAYLHSIYTEKDFRNMGLASQILEQAIALCKSEKIGRLVLNASDAAKPLYEKFGFESVTNAMRFWIV